VALIMDNSDSPIARAIAEYLNPGYGRAEIVRAMSSALLSELQTDILAGDEQLQLKRLILDLRALLAADMQWMQAFRKTLETASDPSDVMLQDHIRRFKDPARRRAFIEEMNALDEHLSKQQQVTMQ
jgi:hypothetical protein